MPTQAPEDPSAIHCPVLHHDDWRTSDGPATGVPHSAGEHRAARKPQCQVGDPLAILHGNRHACAATGHALSGTKKDAAALLQYLEDVSAGVAAGVGAGRSLPEIQKTLTLESYKGWERYDTLRETHIAQVYRTMKGSGAQVAGSR